MAGILRTTATCQRYNDWLLYGGFLNEYRKARGHCRRDTCAALAVTLGATAVAAADDCKIGASSTATTVTKTAIS